MVLYDYCFTAARCAAQGKKIGVCLSVWSVTLFRTSVESFHIVLQNKAICTPNMSPNSINNFLILYVLLVLPLFDRDECVQLRFYVGVCELSYLCRNSVFIYYLWCVRECNVMNIWFVIFMIFAIIISFVVAVCVYLCVVKYTWYYSSENRSYICVFSCSERFDFRYVRYNMIFTKWKWIIVMAIEETTCMCVFCASWTFHILHINAA